jgi:hypothetical protein
MQDTFAGRGGRPPRARSDDEDDDDDGDNGDDEYSIGARLSRPHPPAVRVCVCWHGKLSRLTFFDAPSSRMMGRDDDEDDDWSPPGSPGHWDSVRCAAASRNSLVWFTPSESETAGLSFVASFLPPFFIRTARAEDKALPAQSCCSKRFRPAASRGPAAASS